MKETYLDFTGIYENLRGYESNNEKKDDLFFLDFTNLSGTDLYLDGEAEQVILEKLREQGRAAAPGGIHFIDSGNTHYMSRLYTSLIEEPYCLIFWDHHTDMKPAMFDLLSCGSWAAHVLERDENLCKMIMIGPPEKSFAEIPDKLRQNEKLIFISQETLRAASDGGDGFSQMHSDGGDGFSQMPSDDGEGLSRMISEDGDGFLQKTTDDGIGKLQKVLEQLGQEPIYLSVDKDVLSPEACLTNWDQGDMTLKELCAQLRRVLQGRRLIGADICGGFPGATGPEAGLAERTGRESDAAIVACFCEG